VGVLNWSLIFLTTVRTWTVPDEDINFTPGTGSFASAAHTHVVADITDLDALTGTLIIAGDNTASRTIRLGQQATFADTVVVDVPHASFLVNASTVVLNDGVSGGQVAVGGTGAGENLLLAPNDAFTGGEVQVYALKIVDMDSDFGAVQDVSALSADRTATWPDQDIDLTPGTGSFASAAQGALADTAKQTHLEIATFALALGVDAETGANQTNELLVPRAGTIIRASAVAKTGPTGADLIFDINLNGTTIWSTQSNRLTIAASATEGATTTFNTTAVSQNDNLSIDVDQIGSTIAGSDITVQLEIEFA
jgi:hypothetical protein